MAQALQGPLRFAVAAKVPREHLMACVGAIATAGLLDIESEDVQARLRTEASSLSTLSKLPLLAAMPAAARPAIIAALKLKPKRKRSRAGAEGEKEADEGEEEKAGSGDGKKRKTKPQAGPEDVEWPAPEALNRSEEDLRGITLQINRSPLAVLWAALVCVKLGRDWPTALSLGRGYADALARARGSQIGIDIAPPPPGGAGVEQWAEDVLGTDVVVRRGEGGGLRAVVEGGGVREPAKALSFLKQKLGRDYHAVFQAMNMLADAVPAERLATGEAYALYARFRPEVATGRAGWGQSGGFQLRLVLEERDRIMRAP